MRSLRHALVAAVGAALVLAGSAPAGTATLPERLMTALTVPGVSWLATGAVVIDLETQGVVYAWNEDLPLRPGSNEKLAVAIAALDELGASYRIYTPVLGRGSRDGSVWRGSFFLKGHGDPTLRRADLARLAHSIRSSGITRVTGTIVGDESYFDRRRTAPGWKPSYYKNECAPLSALVVDEANVRGRIVSDPALAAARAFRRALVGAGIGVRGGATKGVAPADAVPIAHDRSPPVSRIVLRMNRPSSNFTAEMLLKHLGAHELGVGTTYAGTRVVVETLRARGVPLAGVRIVDGSGLSRYDRLTARAISQLLVSVWRDPAVSYPFVMSLPLAGVNGTLKNRLRTPPAYANVRAKTGTTSLASALSGYVRTRYVFSVLQNGSPIPWWYARRGQDRFVQTLAGQ